MLQRAVLSPPRLPASCVGFHAVALGHQILASAGAAHAQKNNLLHAK